MLDRNSFSKINKELSDIDISTTIPITVKSLSVMDRVCQNAILKITVVSEKITQLIRVIN